jgi:predicted CoA-binding protein
VIPVKQAATDFLAHKRIAVTGVSRSPKDHGANVVYKRLRDRGYTVFAINPNADEIEGDVCFHDLKSVPGEVEGVVIGTSPQHAEETMREAVDLHIPRVWMHRGPGGGSVSEAAARYGREHGVQVIDGGCPLMFNPTADTGHKIMHLFGVGKMPRQV